MNGSARITSARDHRPPVAATVGFLVLGFASLLAHLHSSGRSTLAWQRLELASTEARPELGHCYLVDLGSAAWAGYSTALSPAELYEGSEPLGPANAQHTDVRTKGSGRYSFWGRHLYFSSSDNSDPRSNGRKYLVRRPYPVPKEVAWCLLSATILVGLRCWFQWDSRARSSRSTPARLSTALADPLLWAVAIGVLAWAVRLVAYIGMLQHPERYVGSTMMGVPFSDAAEWDRLGESVARGEGLVGGWSARRPLYAVLLGGLYVWTGPSSSAAIHLNLLLSALTAATLCRIGWVALHPFVGVMAGLAFGVSTASIDDSMTTMSETTGALLGALAVHSLISSLLRTRPWHAFTSGVLLALSNLARTLSVGALPALALVAAVLHRQRTRSLRKGLRLAFLLVAGTLVTFAPWILRQHLVHGIATLSDNGVAGLYAASTPKFGTWTGAVDREAQESGVPNDVRRRYEYFAAGFSRNLREHPRFYLQNALASFRRDVEGLAVMSASLRPVSLAFVFLMGLSGLTVLKAAKSPHLWLWVTAVGLAAAAEWACPPTLRLAADLVGLGVALLCGQGMVWLLFVYLLASLAMTAAMALGGDPRLLLMSQWTLTYGGLFLPFAILGAYLSWLVGIRWRGWLREGPWASNGAAKWAIDYPALAWLRWLCVAAGIATFGCLLYRTAVPGARRLVPSALPLSNPQSAASYQQARSLFPDILPSEALPQPEALYRALRPGEAEDVLHGRLVVMRGRIARHRYFIPRGVDQIHYARMLHTGSYARTYFYVAGWIGAGQPGPDEALFPGPIPAEFLLNDVVLVGRVDVDRAFPYEEVLLQVLTVTPCGQDGEVRAARTLVARDPDHLARLRELTRCAAPKDEFEPSGGSTCPPSL